MWGWIRKVLATIEGWLKGKDASSPLTPIQECLWNFNLLHHNIRWASDGLELLMGSWLVKAVAAGWTPEKGPLDVPPGTPEFFLRETARHHIIILVSSFLEEWGRLQNLRSGRRDISKTFKVSAPAIKQIQAWQPALTMYRNLMIAHPYRDQAGRLMLPWDVVKQYPPPGTGDAIVLGRCVVFVTGLFLDRHSAEFEAGRKAAKATQIPMEDSSRLQSPARVEGETAKIKAEIDALQKRFPL